MSNNETKRNEFLGDNSLKKHEKNIHLPPNEMQIDRLIDHICNYGSGNILAQNGVPKPWTPASLSIELGLNNADGTTDTTIRNWISGRTLPKIEQLHKLARVVSCGDDYYLKAWTSALINARTETKLRKKEEAIQVTQKGVDSSPFTGHTKEFDSSIIADLDNKLQKNSSNRSLKPSSRFLGGKYLYVAIISLFCFLATLLFWMDAPFKTISVVRNIRVCDEPYFDKKVKDCSKHVSVYMHGIEEVFLSFDFENLAKGEPFERWWIRNGERVAGRTSFNDEAWPGYTYWRPDNGFPVGEYVVRIVIDGKVATQTFSVQKTGFSN